MQGDTEFKQYMHGALPPPTLSLGTLNLALVEDTCKTDQLARLQKIY